jgi:hypothetical protein
VVEQVELERIVNGTAKVTMERNSGSSRCETTVAGQGVPHVQVQVEERAGGG